MKERVPMAAIHLLAATPDLLQQALGGSDALAGALGVRVPAGWAESRAGSLRYTLTKLEADADAFPWWTYLLLYVPEKVLVGSGGFHGPPTPAGLVELGYEVAADYQGRGLATAFAGALVARALASPQVAAVTARTLAEPNASTRVLEKNGFTQVAELVDPTDGPLWLWELKRPEEAVAT